MAFQLASSTRKSENPLVSTFFEFEEHLPEGRKSRALLLPFAHEKKNSSLEGSSSSWVEFELINSPNFLFTVHRTIAIITAQFQKNLNFSKI